MSEKTGNLWQSWASMILFISLVYGFTAATMIKPSAEFSEMENRVLAQRPEASWETIWNGKFENAYERYLADQFVLRDHWIGLKTSAERLLLKRESKDIYFAEDDYLIEKHTGVFTTELAQRNKTALAQMAKKYWQQFGAEHMTVMVVPNAVEILQDKLPPFAPSGDEAGYLEQTEALLPEGAWFDAQAVLREHDQEELYYRTDHHWKTLAAFYVYQAWAKAQGYQIPEVEDYEIRTVSHSFEGTVQAKLGIRTPGDSVELFLPRKEIAYQLEKDHSGETETCLYDDGALDTRDQYAVFFGGNQGFLKITTDAESSRKILVIKDSYANCFIPFMLAEFQEIDVVDLRYFRQTVSRLIAENGYTDLLILYNASGFAQDSGAARMLN